MKQHAWKRRIALIGAGAAVIAGSGAAVAAPAYAAAARHCVNYSYGYGGHSKCIGYIQKLLNYERIGPKSTYENPAPAPNHYTRVAVDNSYGPATRATVIGVQRYWGKPYWGLAADGVVGPKTWKALCSPHQGPGHPGFPLAAARAAGCHI